MAWYYIVLIVLACLLFIYLLMGIIIWSMSVPTKSKMINPEETEESFYDFCNREYEQLKRIPFEEVSIRSFDGLKLHGYFKKGDATTKTIISVHGYKGEALQTSTIFSHWLVDFNYNVLFIDLRSSGLSEGKYTGYGNLDSKDLLSWVHYVVEKVGENAEIALFGVSMGGNTVCNLADKCPEQVKCIIDDCGYTNAYDEMKTIMKKMYVPGFFLSAANLFNKMIAHYDLKKADARKALKNSLVPVLFIHGDKDIFVPTAMGQENYNACTSIKEIHIFKDTPHARSYYNYKEGYKKIVLDFLVKYLA